LPHRAGSPTEFLKVTKISLDELGICVKLDLNILLNNKNPD
jgi:hypothetical protein